jgi:ribonucleoside-diphosphate reductase alpha chain
LCIDPRDVASFAELVGFSVTYKTERLRSLLAARKTIKSQRRFDDVSIVDIRYAGAALTYNLTEPINNLVWANGMLMSQCGEYHFIDDSSCNLSSVNLTRFLVDGRFDVPSFQRVCELLIIAQDIIVDYASYPTSAICENTHAFRALGLGYCNLGSLVMRMGFPYDSEEARAVAAAITSIMTATAYSTSAKLAAALGPFDGYAKNRPAMMKIIDKHRSKAAGIQQKMCPDYLLDASQESWEEARDLGKASGYRNAQVTLLAPTGTISFTMDADTTGVEPAFALVSFKTYAGGGYAKLVIDSVVPALRALGYSEQEIEDVYRYVVGHGSIRQNGSQDGVNVTRLKQIGFTDDVIAKVNARVPDAPDLDSAISAIPEAKVLIDSFLERGGFDAADRAGESPLKMMGFSDDETRAANEHCCGHMTMLGAPHVKPQHMAVFDCASSTSQDGSRTVSPSGHIGMMVAVQPFLSGAISKTVNLPVSATMADIHDIYLDAWNKGLKCVTVYRDGCKTDQPLSVKQKVSKVKVQSDRPRRMEPPTFMDTGGRRKVTIDRYTLYIHAYRDPKSHKVNEVWVNVKPGGGPLAGMMDVTCRLISMLLQYGVPLEELVKKFAFTSFEPAGMTTHPKIPTCRSIADLIFRTLAVDFLGDESYARKVGDDAVIAITEIADNADSYDDVSMIAIANGDDSCPNCGSSDLKPTGNCKACVHCGTSLGCS